MKPKNLRLFIKCEYLLQTRNYISVDIKRDLNFAGEALRGRSDQGVATVYQKHKAVQNPKMKYTA